MSISQECGGVMPVVGIVLVVGLALLAAAAAFAFEKLVPAERREVHNEVVGFVYAVIGVCYAVLLGLVVIGAWNTQEQARANTYTEGNALIWLDWYAYSLPQPQHTQIEDLLEQYTALVINTEWPQMAHQQSSPQAWSVYQAVREVILSQQPTDPAAVARYHVAVNAADQFGAARRERLEQSANGIPWLLWAALIMGGVITIGFAFLFGMKHAAPHAIIVFSVTLLIGGLLLVTYDLDRPFVGSVKVGPQAFELALARMHQLD
jgi:hypothetical protein